MSKYSDLSKNEEVGNDVDQSFQDIVVHMVGGLTLDEDENISPTVSSRLSIVPPHFRKNLIVQPTVWIILKESIVSFLNHFTGKYSMRAEGSIELWGDSELPEGLNLLLEVDDKEKFIMRFEENKSCAEVLNILNEKIEDESTKYECKVLLPKQREPHHHINSCIANYKCCTRGPLSPILLERSITAAGNLLRVEIDVVANPNSSCNSSLRNFVIVVSVPLELKIESVTMPLPKGTWNEVKRIVSWRIPQLPDNDSLKVLAQFKVKDIRKDINNEFPVMVSSVNNCSRDDLVPSKISLNVLTHDPSNIHVKSTSQFEFIHRI